MERTSKVLTINCTQSLICKICTKQNQQMNKTMKEDGGNGNYMDLNFIVARPCLFTNAFKLLLFSFSFFFLKFVVVLVIFHPILHTENKRDWEREIPGSVLESSLSSSKETEAMLSEVKPVFKITWERDTWLLTNWMI